MNIWRMIKMDIKVLSKYVKDNEGKYSYKTLIEKIKKEYGEKVAEDVENEYKKEDPIFKEEVKPSKTLKINNDNWSDIKDYRDNPNTKVDTTVGVLDQYIPKKAAALEICKEVKQIKVIGIGLIISVFVVAFASASNMWVGAATAGIFSIFGAIIIKKAMQKSKYFKENYGVEA